MTLTRHEHDRVSCRVGGALSCSCSCWALENSCRVRVRVLGLGLGLGTNFKVTLFSWDFPI